jgi:glyoxylase-like metal-dependent hydrolase (beta-lactamase superfamily II)
MKELGIKVVASREAADAMATGDHRCIGFAVHRNFEPCEADIIASDGQILEIGDLTFRCITTPGHTDGHLLYEVNLADQQVWFCGDIINTGQECKSVELGIPAGRDFHRPTYLDTLEKLIDMEVDTLCPGHGSPGIGIGKRLVEMAYFAALQKWQ